MHRSAGGQCGSQIRHLIICANPSPHSFDHAIVGAYSDVIRSQGQLIDVRDLYAIGFDPVLRLDERPGGANWTPSSDVAVELEYLRAAAIVVLVYPLWFGFPPAILKGYVDRVLGANYSYQDFQAGVGQPPLVGKPLLSFCTSGLPLSWLQAQGQSMALRDILDVYLWRGFGMKQSSHVMIDSVTPDMTHSYVAEQFGRVRDAAMRAALDLADRPGTAVFES